MQPDVEQLLEQLNVLIGTAAGRRSAFVVARMNITKLPPFGPGATTPATPGESSLLGDIEARIVAENTAWQACVVYQHTVSNWGINDPTRAAQGRSPVGNECPVPPVEVVNYFHFVRDLITPGSTAELVVPTPLAAVTTKPGAPPGANSPFGFI